MLRKKKKQNIDDMEVLELEQEIPKKKARNTESYFVTCFFVILMLAVMGNLIYFVMTDSEIVINNSYNTRQELLATKNIRGKILSRDGDILAQTGRNEEGIEIRYYPYGELFCHAVGYSTKGKSGIELSENINLLTSNDSIMVKIQNEVDSVKNFGDNVVSTLDVDLQKVAYDALGAYDGAVIVTNPSTGEILSLVSKPGFDPNTICDEWETLIADEESSVLLNRVSQGLYPPGSTFKIITALEYFRENAQDVENYSYQCSGHHTYEGNKISCYHGTKHGTVNFERSFEKSCNSSFANIGLSLDSKKLFQTCKGLLFNDELPVSFPYKQSSYVLEKDDSSYDVMQTSIGQGKTQITPLHLNMITCAIANGGKCNQPYMVSGIENYSGNSIKKFSSKSNKTLMSEEEAEFLKQLMAEVVKNGTATKLNVDTYTAAGKTGSAEYNTETTDSHAWFTGFAPVDNPQICVTIIVEGAGSGGDYAVPIAKRIFDEFFSK